MPKKLSLRNLTIAIASGEKDGKEKEKEKAKDQISPITKHPPPPNLKLLTRQLSIMEGGSCPNSPQVKKAYRLVVLGSTQTGKTSIVNRFLNDTFDESYVPTIENFHRKLYRIHGEFYQLDILDTSGNDPFPASRRLSLLTGDLFLLVFSVDKPGSYDECLRLREQILEAKNPHDRLPPSGTTSTSCGDTGSSSTSKKHSTSSSSSGAQKIPIVIAANKIDLIKSKHDLDLDEIRPILDSLSGSSGQSMSYVELSAKTCHNVNEAFSKLFQAAKLPKQMAPGQHRQVTLERSIDSAVSTSSAPVRGENADGGRRASTTRGTSLKSSVRKLTLRSKHSEPAVSFDTDARRPSLRTDLMLLRAKKSSQYFNLSGGGNGGGGSSSIIGQSSTLNNLSMNSSRSDDNDSAGKDGKSETKQMSNGKGTGGGGGLRGRRLVIRDKKCSIQ